MNIRAANQIAPANAVDRLGRKIQTKYSSFQAPFSERRAILLVGDSLLVIMAVFGAFGLWQQVAQASSGSRVDLTAMLLKNWHWFPLLLGGWWLLAWLNDLYDIPSSCNRRLSVGRLLIAGGLGILLYLVLFFLLPRNLLPRLFFLYFLTLNLLLLMGWRWLYGTLFNFTSLQHRLVIVGNGSQGRFIARALAQSPTRLNYRLLGYIIDQPVAPGTTYEGLPVLGQATDLGQLSQTYQVNELVLAQNVGPDNRLFELLVECQAQGVTVTNMADLYETLYHRIPVEFVDPVWLLQMLQGRPVFSRLQLVIKRLLDLLIAVVGLILSALLWPLIALAIKLDSTGPIFYRQTRCGRAGKLFSIVKFRTMVAHAEPDGQARWATTDDDRITRVGRWLRKTRLDELPQLLNVLSGDMSLVGPRPERPEFVETLQPEIPFYRTRLMVKPGLTGWAQIHHDYGNSVADALAKLQYDLFYLRRWSLSLDLYIMFRTAAVMLKFKGT